MPDRNPLAESLLARTTSPDRAAAIYGDLLELAATRGRLWFWAAYTRTIVALTWRWPAALAAAYLCFRYVAPWEWFVDRRRFALGSLVFIMLAEASTILLFVAAFALVRFGLRDRLATLAGCATILLTITAHLYTPDRWWTLALPIFMTATALAVWPQLRRPLAVLIAMIGAYYALFVAMFKWVEVPLIDMTHGYSLSTRQDRVLLVLALGDLLRILLCCMVCSFLHARWLSSQPPARSAV